MIDIAIRVEHLSKQYEIARAKPSYDTLRDDLSKALNSLVVRKHWSLRRRADTIWAVKDVSFEIKKGDIVGIIGRNGAGKSTLLKLLTRITEPTEGRAEIYGRVGSLLEVGTGFHPELTGRENIYLSGVVLGMKRAELNRKFDEIVAFAEVEQFIDTPVKHYSSGMHVRLAFAVAAHLEMEILLIDEVLAVGDVMFQKKCLGKMSEVAHAGRTILFVSHNMGTVQSLCSRAILMRQGRVILDGSVDDAIRDYLGYLATGGEHAFENNPERSGTGQVRLMHARVLDGSNQPVKHLVAGKAASFEFRYRNPAGVRQANVIMTFFNQLGVAATHLDMRLTNFVVQDLGAEGTFVCHIPQLPFPLGQYRIALAVQVNGQNADLIPNVLVFEIESSAFFLSGRTPHLEYCACMVEHEWRHEITAPQITCN